MKEKLKKFYEENKGKILVVGGIIAGGALILLTTKGDKTEDVGNNLSTIENSYSLWDYNRRKKLEEYGAEFKDGYEIPFATKEVATKFLEGEGDTYQINIIDDGIAEIYICQSGYTGEDNV